MGPKSEPCRAAATDRYQEQIKDIRKRYEIEANATRFPDLYRYGVMLPNVAEGIEDGSIRVPR